MRQHSSFHVETTDAWRPGPDRSVPYLGLDTSETYSAVVLHFGLESGRTSASVAVAELEQMIAAALELRNALAADLGRAPISVRADGPDGPDDPDDEPTDEPITAEPDPSTYGTTRAGRSDPDSVYAAAFGRAER